MSHTVKELAALAGVSPRTLRYYDAIGLLPAQRVGRNNDERHYDDSAVVRLQQILFFRELDFRLAEIRTILDAPDFDVLQALRSQKRAIRERRGRLNRLIRTIDHTIAHLEGRRRMEKRQFFEGFDEQKQKEYEREARERWGNEAVDASSRRLATYTKDEQQQMMLEWDAIFGAVREHMHEGVTGAGVQHAIERLHNHVNRYWDCNDDAFRGLGDLYVTDPRFRATFERHDAALPEFLRDAMVHYCDARKLRNR
jgi:DNA-binding transcriptional MerR regulator